MPVRSFSYSALLLVFLISLTAPRLRADELDQLKVGIQPDGRIVVPTNQILKPAGKQVTFPGRPVDLALIDKGCTLVVKNRNDLIFLDVATAKIKQTLKSPTGFSAVGLAVRDDHVYVSDSAKHVRVAGRQLNGPFAWLKAVELSKPKVGGDVYPTGLCPSDDKELWTASSRGNSVQLLDLATGAVKQVVPVGVAPYMLCRPRPERVYVSNWGGDTPSAKETHAPSSGTPVRIDPRGIANHGTVSILESASGKWRLRKSIAIGLHPSGMIASKDGRFVYVANANSDTISVLDTNMEEVVETIVCRPAARLPFGSGANALALSPDGGTLYVANGTNNCIAVVRLGARACTDPDGKPARSAVAGLIPTGWYPGAVLVSADGKKLFVANVKGHGSLSQPRPIEKGKNSHDHLGSVSIIDVPDDAGLARYTDEVNANNRLAYSLAGLEKPNAGAKAVPVPRRHGEPSVFQHVIYVIKENRTYDQVFGDMKEGEGDSRLAIFGEKVTPNQHALAREFTLFDNFYCSGVLSADGHQWVNEAYVTDYLEKAFGRFARSYPYEGSDPLAFASSGFLWDNALARKKTFRNYGEFVKATLPKGTTWTDVFNDYKGEAGKIKIDAKPNVQALTPFTRAGYPGFLLTVPDVRRAQLFIEDLKEYERKGEFPHLTYLYLPCDHTSGTKPDMPTPAAMVADNDLALGQVVEAISKSRFWKDTCIFVVEDDPQNGFDHIDAHRTVALVISPYTRRKFVDRTNYNQTGMVKTIELILGLPPMNQLDLSATPMRHCFQDRADLTPYTCRPNLTPLDQMNPPLKKLRGQARHWAEKSLTLDLDEADEADEDTLNRILWHAVRGDGTPYPEQFAGKRAGAP
ncbi:MAG TPA: bifunctional YncE family protein/alkaline phosphatase family protein [Gemmataceae bacterium]|nr:bifunctional YncE family protein/alkaline phosphatase family protein [Gemmataceae bacterium]